MEELYANDLQSYYLALVNHPHHHYYFGCNEADITPWHEYFPEGMAIVLERGAGELDHPTSDLRQDRTLALLRPFDHRVRRVLGLFARSDLIRSADVASLLEISTRRQKFIKN